jgi:hypothetical protein
MLPYAFTVIVLVIGSREAIRKRLGAPNALGVPYIRGERGKNRQDRLECKKDNHHTRTKLQNV